MWRTFIMVVFATMLSLYLHAKIREKAREGVSTRDLADEFEVHVSTIYRVLAEGERQRARRGRPLATSSYQRRRILTHFLHWKFASPVRWWVNHCRKLCQHVRSWLFWQFGLWLTWWLHLDAWQCPSPSCAPHTRVPRKQGNQGPWMACTLSWPQSNWECMGNPVKEAVSEWENIWEHNRPLESCL